MLLRCGVGLAALLCRALSLKLQLAAEAGPQCDADWGVLGRGKLVRTAHNTRPSDWSSDDRAFTRGVFVQPALRFAVCTIPKVGSLTWMTALCKMLSFDDEVCVEQARGKAGNQVALFSHSLFGSAGYRQVFSDPSATRAVFVRDPLGRFASAFLDKCGAGSRAYCPLPGGGVTFGGAVEWALAADLSTTDDHFRPQAFHCDLQRALPQYTVVGLMDKERFHRDVTCALDLAGLGKYRPSGAMRHSPYPRATRESDVLRRLFTPSAAQRLMRRYAIDYDTFNLSEPAWVANATGEWYNASASEIAKLVGQGGFPDDLV